MSTGCTVTFHTVVQGSGLWTQLQLKVLMAVGGHLDVLHGEPLCLLHVDGKPPNILVFEGDDALFDRVTQQQQLKKQQSLPAGGPAGQAAPGPSGATAGSSTSAQAPAAPASSAQGASYPFHGWSDDAIAGALVDDYLATGVLSVAPELADFGMCHRLDAKGYVPLNVCRGWGTPYTYALQPVFSHVQLTEWGCICSFARRGWHPPTTRNLRISHASAVSLFIYALICFVESDPRVLALCGSSRGQWHSRKSADTNSHRPPVDIQPFMSLDGAGRVRT
jgi:hypothetical protein